MRRPMHYPWYWLLLLCAGYLTAALAWALPYRGIPSDDIHNYATFLETGRRADAAGWQRLITGAQNPGYRLLLAVADVPLARCGLPVRTTLAVIAAAAHALTLLLGCCLLWQAHGRRPLLLAAALLWLVAPWPAFYLVWNFYAPVAATATMLLVAVLSPYRRRCPAWHTWLAITVAAAALYSITPSAPVILLAGGLAAVLTRPGVPNVIRFRRAALVALAVAGSVLLARLFVPRLAGHWLENPGNHADLARQLWGSAPAAPWLSFWRYLAVHEPALTVPGLLLPLAYALLRDREQRRRQLVWLLVMTVWFHTLLVDVLPFTKLARTQFVLYPLLGVALLCMVQAMVARWCTRLGRVLLLLLLAALLQTNAQQVAAYRGRNDAAYAWLAAVCRDGEILLLREDPHARFLPRWLAGLSFRPVGVEELARLRSAPPARPTVLLIGPHGAGSGKTFFYAGMAADYHLPELLPAADAVLPYHAYFPPILLEEEICTGLLYAGRVPDYRLPRANLSAWIMGGADRVPAPRTTTPG